MNINTSCQKGLTELVDDKMLMALMKRASQWRRWPWQGGLVCTLRGKGDSEIFGVVREQHKRKKFKRTGQRQKEQETLRDRTIQETLSRIRFWAVNQRPLI